MPSLTALSPYLFQLVLIPPFWRICARAGFAGAWSLLLLVPMVGLLAICGVLAHRRWPAREAAMAMAQQAGGPKAGGPKAGDRQSRGRKAGARS